MEQDVGTVEFISQHRDFGFIRHKEQGKLYFRMDEAPSEIELKDSVSFQLQPDPNSKHDRAVSIRILTKLPA